MIIISHRGYWKHADEKNHSAAFRRSFDMGFGTETDVRDRMGELVVSHDIPTGKELKFSEMLDLLNGKDLPLAINIKADGISEMIHIEMARRGLTNWFTFDMSVPELIRQLRGGIPAYTRCSEYEPHPCCYQNGKGVWLDAFDSDWYDAQKIHAFLADDKKVCIVSPELHQRDHEKLWNLLKESSVAEHPNLMLCTDRPEDAQLWFGGNDD